MTPLEINKKIAELKGMEVCKEYSIGAVKIVLDRPTHSCMIKDWGNDISDAWELFLEFRSGVAICRTSSFVWEVWDNEKDFGSFESKTAPLAICKAYIKWREG